MATAEVWPFSLFDIGFVAGANTVSLTSLTVTQNTAANDSGGLFVDSALAGSVTVTNCILSGNKLTAAPKGPVDVTFFANGAIAQTPAAALKDQGYNLVGTTDTDFKTGLGTNNPAATDQGGVGALANNGGPLVGSAQTTTLPTCAVPVVSPAYRKGNPDEAFLFDERGFTRNGVNVTIGAEDPDAAP